MSTDTLFMETADYDIDSWTQRMVALQDVASYFSGFNVLDILVGGQQLDVYVALSSNQKTRGLGNIDRSHLDMEGMLFVFEEGSFVPFTAKDMNFDFTICWFDATGRFIASADVSAGYEAPLCCPKQFHYVLETPVGYLDAPQQGLKINGA